MVHVLGHSGSWFANVDGESLPCVHLRWTEGTPPTSYHDPYPRPDSAGKWPKFIRAIQQLQRVVLTESRYEDGKPPRRSAYLGVYSVDEVRIDETGLHFRYKELVVELSKKPTVRTLEIFGDYDRRAIHGLFSPETIFTPQAGTWGLQGTVAIPDRLGDHVFFVTLGQTQSEHKFEEGITDEGVLTWQSQPKQDLSDDRIQQWIEHDETRNDIHLFLRTGARRPYTYFGRLAYLTHDRDRERPVHFQWQLLDWNVTSGVTERIDLALQVEAPPVNSIGSIPNGSALFETSPPLGSSNTGVVTPTFEARKAPDWSAKDARDRALGLQGELLVLEWELQNLRSLGRSDLADMVVHVSATNGDGAGYDIRSFGPDGRLRLIEVKCTRGDISTPFYISQNEVAFSQARPDCFELSRLYELREDGTAKFFTLKGDLTKHLRLDPVSYRAQVAAKDSSRESDMIQP